jgi:tRNA pseudouridine synthase 10
LGWRAFVVELLEPKKRKLNIKKIQKQINKSKKVNVKELKYSNKQTVVRIKTETGDKTYRVRVKLEKSINKKNLRKLKELIGVINQQTPTRVLRRRADLVRKRRVKSLKYKQINKKTLELTIKTAAGLYIKELVSGDNGRSKPSVSEVLDVKATPYDLDVIHIDRPKSL